jgi:hypothetical protein
VDDMLRRVVAAFEAAPLRYSVGGAIAMQAHGLRRYTADVDAFVLEADALRALRVLREAGFTVTPVFAPHHYVATIPEYAAQDPDLRVDVLVPADEPELSAIEYPVRGRLAELDLNVFQLELLVVAKFYAGRPKDHLDFVLMLERGLFDPAKVRAILASYDPEGAASFDELIARLTAPHRPPPRPNGRMRPGR